MPVSSKARNVPAATIGFDPAPPLAISSGLDPLPPLAISSGIRIENKHHHAGESLIPSLTIATTSPELCSSFTFSSGLASAITSSIPTSVAMELAVPQLCCLR
ncbi:hypothetical protein L2E82_30959 [Cichorium intybus]|uniref:Uncharacterized protein n=1 Tax=Cichorium intybus TaxID=13427 RepID=A0ACB9D1Y2_CICIN|nr:hypothetical protein L2E82_30959 [Cichorium intybus]